MESYYAICLYIANDVVVLYVSDVATVSFLLIYFSFAISDGLYSESLGFLFLCLIISLHFTLRRQISWGEFLNF